jgi:hypothetical protein
MLLPIPDGNPHPLGEELLTHDVDVSWWVTPHAYEHGYYTMLYAVLAIALNWVGLNPNPPRKEHR